MEGVDLAEAFLLQETSHQQLSRADVSEASTSVVAVLRKLVRLSHEETARCKSSGPILSLKLQNGAALRGRLLLVQLKSALQGRADGMVAYAIAQG